MYYLDIAMDEYTEQLLNEITAALRAVLQNILVEPIPDSIKRRLLEQLLSRPVPPVRKHRRAKGKALLTEFNPLLSKRIEENYHHF